MDSEQEQGQNQQQGQSPDSRAIDYINSRGKQYGKKLAGKVGKRATRQAGKMAGRAAMQAGRQAVVAVGQGLVSTAPLWGIPALILLIIIIVFIIIFGGANDQNINVGAQQDCATNGGTCSSQPTCSDVPNSQPDPTSTCSDTTKPTCCIQQYAGGGELPPGVFKPPFRCGLSYWGITYGSLNGNPPHTPYSVDFNRGNGYADLGDPVLASANGVVSGYIPSYGQIQIRHVGGYETWYVHMRNIRVRVGDTVRLGQQVGEISNVSPNNSSPHLHVNHRLNGVSIKVAYNNVPYPASLFRLPAGATRIGPTITGECP